MMSGPDAEIAESCEQQTDRQHTADVRASAIFVLIKAASMLAGAYLLRDDYVTEAIVLAAAGLFFAGCGIAGLLAPRS